MLQAGLCAVAKSLIVHCDSSSVGFDDLMTRVTFLAPDMGMSEEFDTEIIG